MTQVWAIAKRKRAHTRAGLALRSTRGYSLVELMVVLVIVGILLVIGIPALLGARVRSQDRAAQSNIANVYTAEKILFSDASAYTADPVAVHAAEPSLTYAAADTPSVVGTVYLYLEPGDIIYLMAKSESGVCFYLRDPDGAGAIYASSPNCGKGPLQTYGASW